MSSNGQEGSAMKTVIVYESMYGNTRAIADAIARDLGPECETVVVSVSQAGPDLLEGAGLVVVGGPTHLHGMSRAATRKSATEAAAKPGSPLRMDPGADGPGLRDWFAGLGQVSATAAAFDTRLKGPAVLTGQASKGITRLLRAHGFTVAAQPQSFLVTKANVLRAGEQDRAAVWGRQLASTVAATRAGAIGHKG
jgi:hypothetical protein